MTSPGTNLPGMKSARLNKRHPHNETRMRATSHCSVLHRERPRLAIRAVREVCHFRRRAASHDRNCSWPSRSAGPAEGPALPSCLAIDDHEVGARNTDRRRWRR